jgi:hypothetical protein
MAESAAGPRWNAAREAPAATEAKKLFAIGRSRRAGIYVVGGGLWLSGALWLLFHYFMQSRGEFAVVPHPLEPWWLRLHGAFAFGAIWVFGLLWSAHVSPGWAGGKRRRSGAALVGLFLWLTLTGYLLYYLGHEWLRSLTSLLHWSLGLLIPVLFLLHRLAAEPAKVRQPRRSSAKRP